MTTNKVIANSIVNLATQILPVFIAIIFIPLDIKFLGKEIFGIYSLLITMIILFNYLNFGIAPATTKEIAKHLARKEYAKSISLLLNSFLIMLTIGVLLSLILVAFKESIANLLISNNLYKPIFINLLVLMSILSPILMGVIFLRAALEAKQQFVITSINRSLLNSILFIIPILVYFDNIDIQTIFKIIILMYIVSFVVLSFYTYKYYLQNKKIEFNFYDTLLLLRVGFWMMLSSIAGIGLYYADRFIISSIISTVAVAYYVAAYDLVTRLNIISGSITSALFPAFSHWYEKHEYSNIIDAISFVSKVILLLVSLVGIILIIEAKEILSWWINDDFSKHSHIVMQVLVIGVLFNALSVVPFRALSAIGFQKIVALVFITEMPFAVLITYFLIKYYGLIGAVIGYNIRAFFEAMILFSFLNTKNVGLNININKFSLARIFTFYIFIYLFAYLGAYYTNDQIYKTLTIIVLIITILIVNVFSFFNQKEKQKMKERLNRLRVVL